MILGSSQKKVCSALPILAFVLASGFLTNSNALVIDREVTTLNKDTIVTSRGESFSYQSPLQPGSLQALQRAQKKKTIVSLIINGEWVTEVVDLNQNINQDALELGLRAEKSAQTPEVSRIQTTVE